MATVETIRQTFPQAKEFCQNTEGMSGASMFSIPDYYTGEMAEKFAPEAILKITPSGTLTEPEIDMFALQQNICGPEYEDLFWPYQVVTLNAPVTIQGLLAPKFKETPIDIFRAATPPSNKQTADIIAGISQTLEGVNAMYQGPADWRVGEEIRQSLIFTSDTLRSQLPDNSLYGLVPNKLVAVASVIPKLIPNYTSLSGNDCWLGNFALSQKDSRIRIFDPLPILPLVQANEFTRYLEQQQFTVPLLRNIFLDFSRVSVNLNRISLEWQKRGWIESANFMREEVAPAFRQQAKQIVGESALIAGELINNAYFAVCNCNGCTESGSLQLSINEVDRLSSLLI